MQVNICMAVRDRFELTEKVIAAFVRGNNLLNATLTVVDDESQEPTRELIESLGRLNPETCYSVRNDVSLGVGGSKNRAVMESEKRFGRGKYILIFDNDALWQTRGVERIIAAYEASKPHGIRILGGYAHPYNGTNSVIESNGYTVHTKNAVDGLSWLMEWETWDKYGPLMDNARGVRQSEDWEWCQRVRNDGFEVGVIYPHVVTNLGLIDTFGEEIPGAQQVREQQGMLQ